MATAYAERTKVTEQNSRAELEEILERFGVTDFQTRKTPNRVDICFLHKGFGFKVGVSLPDADAQERRRLWRVLVMQVKANIVAVEDGVVRFEDAFMPYMVMRDGRTLSESLVPALRENAASVQLSLPARSD